MNDISMTQTTLRPGLLVSLKTSINGNVSYVKRDLETKKIVKDGAAVAKWETERTISDPKEYEDATKARSTARTLIRGVCAHSAFGLLCPESDAAELDKAMAEARQVITAFNNSAKVTRINLYLIAGKIAADDVEAVKAINSEVRDMLEMMEEGIKNFDVKKIREAAADAKQLGSMLSPDAQARITVAIDAARSAARKIVSAGEAAGAEIDTRAVRSITEARTAFLDLDDDAKVAAPRAVASAVDFAPRQPPAQQTLPLDAEKPAPTAEAKPARKRGKAKPKKAAKKAKARNGAKPKAKAAAKVKAAVPTEAAVRKPQPQKVAKVELD